MHIHTGWFRENIIANKRIYCLKSDCFWTTLYSVATSTILISCWNSKTLFLIFRKKVKEQN